MTDVLFVDVETSGEPHTGKLLLVGSALGDGHVWVEGEETFKDSDNCDALADPNVTKVSHTLYDAGWFTKRGYEVAGPWHDTRVMAWCVNENTPLDLDSLLQQYCGAKMDKRLVQFANRVLFRTDNYEMMWALDSTETWPADVWQQFKDYCARDVAALRTLYNELLVALQETEGYDYWLSEEVPFTPLLVEMEKNGLPVDLAATERLAGELRQERARSELKLRRLAQLPASFNLGSPDQLCQYLFSRHFKLADRLPMDTDPLPPDTAFEVTKVARLYIHGTWLLRGRGLAPTPPTKRKLDSGEVMDGKHPSTATPDLLYKHPNDPWVRELCLVYRRADKLLTTYLDKFPRIAVNDRVYGRFNQAGGGTHGDDESRELRASESGTQTSTEDKLDGQGLQVRLHADTSGSDEAGLRPTSSLVGGAEGGPLPEAGRGCRPPGREQGEQRPEQPVGVAEQDSSSDGLVGSLLRPKLEHRIFGRFNQSGTVTGRLSSSDPNLQNIPVRHEWGTRVRELFVGKFVIGDYDSLEMRLMAHFSGDRELRRIFREGLDPHARTAYALFGVEVEHDDPRRYIGKTVNYATGYGAGPQKLAQVLSLEGYATMQSTAKGYLKAVTGFYPGFFRWAEHQKYLAKENGGVNMLSGRRRHLSGAFKDAATWKQMMYGERQAVNSIIQGSAADIIRRGMVAVAARVPELRLLAQIHDEVLWEYDKRPSKELLASVSLLMERGHGFSLRVPLVFEPKVCRTWAEKGTDTTAIESLEEEQRVR